MHNTLTSPILSSVNMESRWVTPTIWVDASQDEPSMVTYRNGNEVHVFNSDRLAYRFLRGRGTSRMHARYQINSSHGFLS
jgi:hypothetical protein